MTDDAEIDRVYAEVDALLCAGAYAKVDALLAATDPLVLPAEVIVAWLVITLAARDRLPSRPDFIGRARPVLDAESEGADAVLAGLVPESGHPADCQSCSEGSEPCLNHAEISSFFSEEDE